MFHLLLMLNRTEHEPCMTVAREPAISIHPDRKVSGSQGTRQAELRTEKRKTSQPEVASMAACESTVISEGTAWLQHLTSQVISMK